MVRETQIRSVKYNAVMNILLMASSMFINVLTIPYVTRALSVDGFGNVSFAQSVSTWLSAFCLLGINVYGVRECARVRDNPVELSKVVRELLGIITVSTVVVLGVFALAIAIVPMFSSIAPLMWVFLVGTLMLSYGVEWFYQGLEQYAYITKRSLIFKIISFVATVLLVKEPDDYLVYGAILAIVMCGNNLFNFIRLGKIVDLSCGGKLNYRRHFKSLLAFASQSISSAVYLSFDSTLLGFIAQDNYEVGLYQLATKLKGIMYQVLNAVLGVFIPRLSHRYGSGDREGYHSLLARGFGLSLNVCIAISCYLFIFSGQVVELISGPEYAGATLPLAIVGIVNFFSCMSYFFGLCILTPLNREKQLAIANATGVPVSIILNFMLDPSLGAVGASLSILVAEMIIFIQQVWYSRDVLAGIVNVRVLSRIFCSNCIAFAVCVLAYDFLELVGPFSSLLGLGLYAFIDMAGAYLLGDETAREIIRILKLKIDKSVCL